MIQVNKFLLRNIFRTVLRGILRQRAERKNVVIFFIKTELSDLV